MELPFIFSLNKVKTNYCVICVPVRHWVIPPRDTIQTKKIELVFDQSVLRDWNLIILHASKGVCKGVSEFVSQRVVECWHKQLNFVFLFSLVCGALSVVKGFNCVSLRSWINPFRDLTHFWFFALSPPFVLTRFFAFKHFKGFLTCFRFKGVMLPFLLFFRVS